jgi:hypothetical protein
MARKTIVSKSLRPKSREEALKQREEREFKEESARLSSEDFGDTEFRVGLEDQLSWNPIARLGYDPKSGKVDQLISGKGGFAGHIPESNTQESVDNLLKSNKDFSNFVGKVSPGDVFLTPNLAESPIWSHEYTHKGVGKLEQYYKKDPEGFKKKYGVDATNLLKKMAKGGEKEEAFTELFDDLSKELHGIRENMSGYADSDFSPSVEKGRDRLQEALKSSRASDLSNIGVHSLETLLGVGLRGSVGLALAAEDLLKEQGEPPRSYQRKPSWFETLKNKIGFAEGGLADDGMERKTAADKQTDTLLGATPEEWSNYTDKLVSEYEPLTEVTLKDLATFVAEMTPIIGDAMAAKDIYEELKKEEPNYYLVGALGGATLIGLIPGLGDVAAKAIKKGAKEVFDVAKRVEIDPDAVGSLGGNVRLKPSDKPIKNPPRFNEEALRVAANQNDKSREILVDMPIEDFLQAAKKDLSAEKLENTRKLVSEGKPFDSVPSLSFKNNADGTGKVTGHDGRHRAIALREQGETTIPVRLISEGGDGPGIRWGQQNDPDSFDYVDVIPQKLIEEDGTSLVSMPEKAANIRLTKNTTKKQKYAEGGEVKTMEKQMNLFEAGGLADDGMEREPVTGNEIPPGSMASEVRDDVPAQLSEGEYVVPADVVRYFGVKFFEDLRGEAKSDMMEMEADGRIGGTPVDTNGIPLEEDEALTPEEEAMLAEAMAADQPQGMASGGVVKGFSDGGLQTTSYVPTSPYSVGGAYNTAGAYGSSGGFEARQYVDTSTGQTRTFQFLNGKPISFIPKNFVPATKAALEQAQNAETTQSQGTGVNTGSFSGGGEGPGNPDNNNPNSSTSGQGLRGIDVNDPLSGVSDTISNAGKIGGTLGGLAGMVGLGPLGARIGTNIGKGLGTADALSDAAASIAVAETLGYDVTEAQEALNEALDGLKGSTKSVTINSIENQTKSAMDALFSFETVDSGMINATNPETDPNSSFQSVDAFNEAMEAVAPTGMSYDADSGSYSSEGGLGTGGVNDARGLETSFSPESAAVTGPPAQPSFKGGNESAPAPSFQGPNPDGTAGYGGGDGGGGDGGTVICTALHAMGRLDDDIYALDAAYGLRISVEDPALRLGYQRWATPFAQYIQGDSLGSKIALEFITPIARAWAQQMAHQMAPEDYKPHKLGKFLQVVGYPICRALGKSKQEEVNGS